MQTLGILLHLLVVAPAIAAPVGDASMEARVVEERASWDAVRWIGEVDARADQLPGLRYSARRTTVRGDVRFEERWRLILAEGDHFRVDYFGDTARQITCDGHILLDYVPAMGKAVRWDLDALPSEDRRSMLEAVLKRVGVAGFRLGEAHGVSWSLTDEVLEGRPVVRLVGAGSDETELSYVIDKQMVAVRHMLIKQAGQTILDARPSDLREIHPGVYFPHAVEMETPDEGGLARVSVRLTKVSAVADSPEKLFTTTLDPSIPVEEKP
ncbi:MAG: hypothetical protein KC912_12625 [Proteobacteria bacterium]|nr:hypothetical protein [Pseudomonadota bacterium]